MDKVKKFLERYVEWLAIALGLGFLGWTIYGYIVSKPVSSTVGSTADVSPAEVDPLVWSGPGQHLKSEIDNKAAAPLPDPVQDYPQVAIDSRSKVPASVTTVFPGTYVPLTPAPDMGDVAVNTPHKDIAGHVTKLPEAPAPVMLLVSQGHSNVPAPTPTATDGSVQPAAGNQAVDKNWRTVAGTIPVADLAKSFADCKIPAVFSSTAILRVTLIREARDGSGNWGPETEVPGLETNVLQPMPASNAAPNDQINYFEWAEKNVEMIAAPQFYKVLQGDVWYEPGTKNPNQVDTAVVEDTFDFQNPLAFKGDINSLTADELKAYKDAQAAKAKSSQRKTSPKSQVPQLPPGFNPGFPPGGGGPGGGRAPAVPDSGRDNAGPPMGPPPGWPGFNPGADGPGGPGMPPQSVTSTNTTLPAGSFNPATQANIKIWAHDATVEPGKTYRYKLKYILSNPVARTQGLCVPPTLAQQFDIQSPASVWTDAVSVESDTNFYAVDTKHGVRFDIFKWKNGMYQMQTVQVNAGDMVGTSDATPAVNTDFTTHWTLVDVREDPRDETNKTIVLVSDNGTVLRKELVTDQHSAQYRRLLEQFNKAKNTNGGGNGAGPPPVPQI